MRWVGALLLALSGVLMGLCRVEKNRRRVRSLEELCMLMDRMNTELVCRKTPLPRLFRELGEGVSGTAGMLCRSVSEALSAGEMFLPAWRAALGSVSREEQAVLMPLGDMLGRYGAEELSPLLSAARERLGRCLGEAQGRGRERSRVCMGLYGAGGILLAILLM